MVLIAKLADHSIKRVSLLIIMLIE